MKAKPFILRQLRLKGSVGSSDLARALDISRQTVHQHLRELISAKKLIKVGSTRSAQYVLFSAKRAAQISRAPKFLRQYRLHKLNEDRVFTEAALKLTLSRQLSGAAFKIVRYAFTEMLNNAIDHSQSMRARIFLECVNGQLTFEIRDSGIGAFESIRQKFKFHDHFESVEHLLKGKQSADPEHHSGQGIFFTSKIADRFVLESARLKLMVDHRLGDTILEDIHRPLKGTRVRFQLKQRSRKDLKELFDEYSNDAFEFHKTHIIVSLSKKEREHVSRSEAKRLLFRLDEFKHIVLDFKHVTGIGQGFADEIFRVFQSAHPDIKIEPIHMAPSVGFMVKRVQQSTLRPNY